MRAAWLLVFGLVALASGAPEALGMTFREASSGGNCSSCTWISADGDVELNSADELRKFVESHGINYHALIRLNSGGGSLAGGFALGELIRHLQLDTAVNVTKSEWDANDGKNFDTEGPGVCASACAYAFLGGVHRSLDADSQIGFHQFSLARPNLRTGNVMDDTQRTVAAAGLYVAEMGAKSELVFLASSASPTEVIWLDRPTMEALNVVTDRAQIVESEWKIQPYRSGIMAQAIQPQPDGSTTIFSIVCDRGAFHFSLARKFDRAPANLRTKIAQDVRSIAFKQGQLNLTTDITTTTSVSEDQFAATIPIDLQTISKIAGSNIPIDIDIGVSHAYMDYVGGWNQEMSVTGLRVALGLVSKNCAN